MCCACTGRSLLQAHHRASSFSQHGPRTSGQHCPRASPWCHAPRYFIRGQLHSEPKEGGTEHSQTETTVMSWDRSAITITLLFYQHIPISVVHLSFLHLFCLCAAGTNKSPELRADRSMQRQTLLDGKGMPFGYGDATTRKNLSPSV